MRRWTCGVAQRLSRKTSETHASTSSLSRRRLHASSTTSSDVAAAAASTQTQVVHDTDASVLQHQHRPQAQTQAHATSPSPTPPKSKLSKVDPHSLLNAELTRIRTSLLNLLGSSHPGLTSIAEYYFKHPSKQLRPLLVLLFSQATNGLGRGWDEKWWAAGWEGVARDARGPGSGGWGATTEELDQPLSRADVLCDWNPNMPDHTASFESVFELRCPSNAKPKPSYPLASSSSSARVHVPTLPTPAPLLPTQRRLAQIVEMIHVASLLHDDVIDRSPLRRGVPSAPAAFGNKFSVLAGDFLLGRASAALSRLGEVEVVELISSVITNLVEGEILQMGRVGEDKLGVEDGETSVDAGAGAGAGTNGRINGDVWNVYLKKTYLKTASLMAKGARAAVVLGGAKEGEVWKEVAYAYGRNLGIAFQLVDDILDYEAGEGTLGKPGGADLRLGLATGPALYAWEEHEAMGPLIMRKFKQEGDVELARDLVRRSSGVERTRDLARAHADKAREVLEHLPPSDARTALEALTERVVKRTW